MPSGDLAGSQQVVEAAMAAGREPRTSTSRSWPRRSMPSATCGSPGAVGIEQEHLASSVAASVIGRLGGEVRPSRSEEGDRHCRDAVGRATRSGVAMLADVLTQDGYEVRNLVRTPSAPSLVAAMRGADQLAAVVVSVVDASHRPAAEELLSAAHREQPTLPIAGGYAVPDERSAVELGAAGWTPIHASSPA